MGKAGARMVFLHVPRWVKPLSSGTFTISGVSLVLVSSVISYQALTLVTQPRVIVVFYTELNISITAASLPRTGMPYRQVDARFLRLTSGLWVAGRMFESMASPQLSLLTVHWIVRFAASARILQTGGHAGDGA